jgi:glycosyltransferase involved in cell wall biosynthesis
MTAPAPRPDPPTARAPVLVHLTTTDMSLALLLGPQLSAFRAAGYDVVGVSAPGRYVAELEARGIRHVPLAHSTRAMAPHRDAAAVAELVQVLRALRPDIVHTHNPKPGVYGRLVARAVGVPAVVNTVHGLYALPEEPLRKRALVYGLERLAASCSRAELVQNPEDLETLRRIGVPDHRLVLLGNGIDLTRFDPERIAPARRAALRGAIGAEPDDVVVGVVGRLVWEKGYREVFAAAEQLRDRAPRVHFVVVGPLDSDKGDSVTQADLDAVGGRARITFLGLRDDVHELYAAMDLYVLASHREGFPRSAMEAAAMGLPVVVTDIRGGRQVVTPAVTGLLVPVRDAGALADAVAVLADDPARRQAMAVAARAKARAEFDQQSVIDTTLRVYERLLPGATRWR